MPAAVPRTPPPHVSSLPRPPRTPQTPRHHKTPCNHGLDGTKPLTDRLKPAALGKRLKHALKLTFQPDPWQLELISRVLRGFDAILCAGTGYGKSLIFEGLAVLGGKKKVVIVISPLKALEKDQVLQASAKGINAMLINEDNSHQSAVWETARTTAQLLYLSPEMAQSDGFAKLWKNNQFRARLQAVAVDEAHCVEEWGTNDFRPEYRSLNVLRHFTGQEIPFVAFTATSMTSTFELLWESLAYGFRPFWGLDVGCDRPNLYYEVRAITKKNQKTPVLDVLGLLPEQMDDSTPASALPKTILYFDSEDACRVATDTLRKCLPSHLRSTVYPFSSILSEGAKEQCWSRFSSSQYRFLCATDAAGMGCNISDIQNVVIFNCPRSLSVVSQRWGRAGRDRRTPAMCLLLVPQWAFRPSPPLEPASTQAVQQLKGKKKALLEPKSHTIKRSKLPHAIEGFVNAGADDEEGGSERCLHQVFRRAFAPSTQLTVYTDLANRTRQETGGRSLASSFSLTWTVLELGRHPPDTRCCSLCNPSHPHRLAHPVPNDPRMSRYAHEFLVPLVEPPTRSPSVMTVASQAGCSDTSTDDAGVPFEPLVGDHSIPKETRELLRRELAQWRDRGREDDERDLTFLSSAVDFPDKMIEKLVENCARFLSVAEVQPQEILKVVKWDSSTERDREEVAGVISLWRIGAALTATPKSQRRQRKKARTAGNMAPPPSHVDVDLSPSPSPRPLPVLSPNATPRARGHREANGRPIPFHIPASPMAVHDRMHDVFSSPVRPSTVMSAAPGLRAAFPQAITPPPSQDHVAPMLMSPVPAGSSGVDYSRIMTPPPTQRNAMPVQPSYPLLSTPPVPPMRMFTPPTMQPRIMFPPMSYPVPSTPVPPSPGPSSYSVVYSPMYYPYPYPPFQR